MITASFRRFLRPDDLDRTKALQKACRRKGLRLVARNGGSRTVHLTFITFWRGRELVSQHWSIAAVEAWLQAFAVECSPCAISEARRRLA